MGHWLGPGCPYQFNLRLEQGNGLPMELSPYSQTTPDSVDSLHTLSHYLLRRAAGRSNSRAAFYRHLVDGLLHTEEFCNNRWVGGSREIDPAVARPKDGRLWPDPDKHWKESTAYKWTNVATLRQIKAIFNRCWYPFYWHNCTQCKLIALRHTGKTIAHWLCYLKHV